MVIYPPINVISPEELERLTALRYEDGIISLYLCARPETSNAERQFLSQFRQAFHRFRRRTTDPTWLRAAEREKARIEDYLRWRKPVRGSLVLFSCQPAGLWEIFDINVPVPMVLDVDSRVRTWILSEVLDHPRIGRSKDRVGAYIEEFGTSGRADRRTANWTDGRG